MGNLLGPLEAIMATARGNSQTCISTQEAHNLCPFGLCDGNGWIQTDEENTVTMCACEEQRQKQQHIERLFAHANVPPRYAGKRLGDVDSIRCGAAYEAARAFVTQWDRVRKQGQWLFLSGPVGTGKTLIAYAIVNELVERGVAAVAETVPELMDQLRPAHGSDDYANDRVAMLQHADLLLLDDLGAQKTTEWVTERLFVVLDARYRNLLPTIITSNEYLEDLDQLPGWQRICSRIAQQAVMVRMDGEDYRLEAARTALANSKGDR